MNLSDFFTAFLFAIPIGAGFTVGLVSVIVSAKKIGIKL